MQSFPLCRLQCLQAENFCGEAFDCTSFTSENCMMFLPTGYFLLDPKQGPYDHLSVVYSVCLAGWVIIALGWHIGAFYLYKDSSVIICKAVSTLPLVKVVVLIIGTAFWTTCEEWEMCSFWLGVSLINTHLVYETGVMVCLLLIAKGWSITRENFSANEWRGIIISMSAFYMSNSIILVLEASVLTKQGFWIACTILYGMMYLYIVQSASSQILLMKRQVDLLASAGEVPDAIGWPLRSKYYMYIFFLFLVLCSICLEISLHALLNNYGKMWLVLAVYEICGLVICGTIFFVFRPRDHSPFFFMVPATLHDTRTRPIPIIEGTDDDSDMAEIEISPLLGAHRNVNRSMNSNHDRNDKMVIVRNPGGDVMVGMSPVMQTRSHHGGAGGRDVQRGYVISRGGGGGGGGGAMSGQFHFENRLYRGIDSSLPPSQTPPPPGRSHRVGAEGGAPLPSSSSSSVQMTAVAGTGVGTVTGAGAGTGAGTSNRSSSNNTGSGGAFIDESMNAVSY
jgi:hypothetical protein